MLFWVEQVFVGRDEIRAPLKTPVWEAIFRLSVCSIFRFGEFAFCLFLIRIKAREYDEI